MKSERSEIVEDGERSPKVASRQGWDFYPDMSETSVVYLLFLILSLAAMAAMIRILRRAIASKSWPKTLGKMAHSRVKTWTELNRDGDTSTRSANVTYRYSVDGRRFIGRRITVAADASFTSRRFNKVCERFPPGSQVPVYYDPDKPSFSVLERGVTGSLCLWLLLPCTFILIATFGLLHELYGLDSYKLGKLAKKAYYGTRESPAVNGELFKNSVLHQCVNIFTLHKGWKDPEEVTEIRCYEEGIDDLTGIGQFPNLEWLFISSDLLVDLSTSDYIPSLRFLNVSNSGLVSLEGVEQMPGLERLAASGNKIEHIRPLSSLKALEDVSVYINNIKDLSLLSGLTNLKVIGVQSNPISCEQIAAFRSSHPGVTVHSGNSVCP